VSVNRSYLHEAAQEWLMARDVALGFLAELRPDLSRAQLETNAAALLARLAAHEPPLLVKVPDADPA